MAHLKIGTATAQRGAIVNGWFEALKLPSGGSEDFPVIIAQGSNPEGPVIWLTTSIHGTEHTGLITIQHLLTPQLVTRMCGTVVAIPALNPAGLRTKQRRPYYAQSDPNRLFPAPFKQNQKANNSIHTTTSGLEDAYQRLYDIIVASEPTYLIDLHNAWIGSVPFVFRDPVFYGRGIGQSRSRREAQQLQQRVDALIEAFGFTVVNEFVAESYVQRDLHRSVSGSILNGGNIPSVTVELGSWMHIDAGVVEGCLTGLRNVLRLAGMLDDVIQPVRDIPVLKPGYPVRRHMHPLAPEAGIVHHLVRPGEAVKNRQVLARLTDIFGQPVGPDDGLLRSEHEGFVLGWQHGVVRYKGEAIMALAIRDDADLVVPFPET